MSNDYPKWLAEQQEQERRRRAELPIIQRQLISDLAKFAITTASVGYDGEGDSGQIARITAYDPDGVPVDLFRYANTPIEPGEFQLRERLEDLAWRLLAEHHEGFEMDDGSYGTITIDVPKGSVAIEHSARLGNFTTRTET